MAFRVSKQSISVPTVSGYGNIPDVGTASHESDGYHADTVLGGPHVGIARPDFATSNSLVHGIFRDPIEIRIERLAARVRKDDFNALLELAYLSEGKDDPVNLRNLWWIEMRSHGEVKTSPHLLETDLWQLTPARRALKRAVEEFIQRNHDDAETLRAFQEWEDTLCLDEEIDDDGLDRICHSIALIAMALGDCACVDDRALRTVDFLYSVGGQLGLGSRYPELLGAEESGLDAKVPNWWIEVEFRHKGPIPAVLCGVTPSYISELRGRASSVGQIRHARYLEHHLEVSQSTREKSALYKRMEKEGNFRELIEIMVEAPRECVAAMAEMSREIDRGFANEAVRRMVWSGHPDLPLAISALADEARDNPYAFLILALFVIEGNEEAWRSLENFDVATLRALVEAKPRLCYVLEDIAEKRRLTSGPIREVLDSPDIAALFETVRSQDERGDVQNRPADILPFKPLTDPE